MSKCALSGRLYKPPSEREVARGGGVFNLIILIDLSGESVAVDRDESAEGARHSGDTGKRCGAQAAAELRIGRLDESPELAQRRVRLLGLCQISEHRDDSGVDADMSNEVSVQLGASYTVS